MPGIVKIYPRFEPYLRALEITDADKEAAQFLWTILAPKIDYIIDRFYSKIGQRKLAFMSRAISWARSRKSSERTGKNCSPLSSTKNARAVSIGLDCDIAKSNLGPPGT